MFRQSSSKHKALDAAEKVFREIAENSDPKPLKYGVIATLAGSQGWSHTGKQSAAQVMYEALKDGLANGETRFTFHGRGYFSLTEHNISDNELPEYAAVKRLGRKQKQEMLEEIYDEPVYIKQVCGRCAHLNFNGIKEITLEGGICMNEQSERCGVRYETSACPLWFQRSERQIETDYERQTLLKNSLRMINNNKLNGRIPNRAGSNKTIRNGREG